MDAWRLRADKYVLAALYPCFIKNIPQNVRKGYFLGDFILFLWTAIVSLAVFIQKTVGIDGF